MVLNVIALALRSVAPSTTAPTTEPATLPTTLPTARQLLDRHIEATGGRAAHASITSRRSSGTFTMADLGIAGTISTAQRADGNAALAIDVPAFGTFRQGVSDGVVWSIHPSEGPRLLDGAEAAALARSLKLSPELTPDEDRDARVLKPVSLNGRPTHRLSLGGAGGVTETRFYDVESGLLVRTVATTPSAVGELTVTTRHTDYEDVPPIRLAMKTQQSMPGLSPESAMTKVEHNVALPDALFALPPEIIALQQQPTTRPAP